MKWSRQTWVLFFVFAFGCSQLLLSQEIDVRKKGSRRKVSQENTENVETPKKKEESMQSGTISGVIKDENGEGLPGAAIGLIGTPYGTLSQLDGSFALSNLPKGNY